MAPHERGTGQGACRWLNRSWAVLVLTRGDLEVQKPPSALRRNLKAAMEHEENPGRGQYRKESPRTAGAELTQGRPGEHPAARNACPVLSAGSARPSSSTQLAALKDLEAPKKARGPETFRALPGNPECEGQVGAPEATRDQNRRNAPDRQRLTHLGTFPQVASDQRPVGAPRR